MVVGLGTGSTADFAIAALVRRVRQGLDIVAIPSSERSAAQARAGGIRLVDFAEHRQIDLTIDGADEILPGPLHLVKGHGGALLREKIVAIAAPKLEAAPDDIELEQSRATVRGTPCAAQPARNSATFCSECRSTSGW